MPNFPRDMGVPDKNMGVPDKNDAGRRLGGHVLVDQLVVHGVDTVFGVPGESFLSALDGCHDASALRFINARHEGGAAMMADAYGKLTGRPGVAFVTRGPGATNASAGVHVAFQDSTPMILLIGQVGRDMQEREAFQEIDYRRMFGQMAKWVSQIDNASRIPEFLSRAFYTATSGRPGPVVLALPEDVLDTHVVVADAPAFKCLDIAPSAAAMHSLESLLIRAQRPFAIVGGSGWSEQVRRDFEAFALRHDMAVGTSFRCQDYIDNQHPNYAGHVGIGINPELAAAIGDADLVLAMGARLGEMTTAGYTLLDVPRPRQALVHVYPDPAEIGRVYAPDLGIVATAGPMASALAGLGSRTDGGVNGGTPTHNSRAEWVARLHGSYLAHTQPTCSPGSVQLAEIVQGLSDSLPNDTIVCNGAGNYTVWVHRFWQYRRYRTGLAPTSGSMGYGLPAAVAAQLLDPDRLVIAFAGDGCLQMTGFEFMTAVQYALPIIVIVCNNGMYGTIRMHQERRFPGRVSGTDLKTPDFAAFARSCGGFGLVVERTEDFPEAFSAARASGLAAILELRTDPEALTPTATLSGTRSIALDAQ